MSRLFVLILAITAASCTADEIRTANDARNALCDLVGNEQRSQIESEGAKVGFSPADALRIWRETCLVRVQIAEREAIGEIGKVAP